MNSIRILESFEPRRALNDRLHTLENRLPFVSAAAWRMILLTGAASAAACLLWALRVMVSGRLQHLFLPWNLFLAWLPLGFALTALHLGRVRGGRSWSAWIAAGGWLCFFPNAPYLFTDLVHLRSGGDHRYWIDLIMVLLFAWPGFLVGCLSLRLMHDAVAGRKGWLIGWGFAAVACGLGGVGVYIGRFLRWNSWDIVVNPLEIAFDLAGFLGHPPTHPAYRFAILFGVLLFFGYATLPIPSRPAAGSINAGTRRAYGPGV